MRWTFLKITPLAILSFVLELSGQTREPCSILRVLDVSHVELVSGERIGLIGVQPFANSASASPRVKIFLDSLLIGQPVEIEFDNNITVAGAYLWRDSLLVNYEVLRLGLAQVWDDTLHFKFREKFLAAERGAKAVRRGNWQFAAVDSVALSATADGDDTVYVTKAGKKYHHADCRLLSENKIALSLSQARLKYTACRSCMTATPPAKLLPQRQGDAKMVTVRCWAKTKKGEPCKREAEPGLKYCWQHRPK
jgi:hypothetical protein